MKESLYRNAFSKLFKCYVSIKHAYQDRDGEWIFVGENLKEGLKNQLFREYELKEFTI
jgi:hypothetical protein